MKDRDCNTESRYAASAGNYYRWNSDWLCGNFYPWNFLDYYNDDSCRNSRGGNEWTDEYVHSKFIKIDKVNLRLMGPHSAMNTQPAFVATYTVSEPAIVRYSPVYRIYDVLTTSVVS